MHHTMSDDTDFARYADDSRSLGGELGAQAAIDASVNGKGPFLLATHAGCASEARLDSGLAGTSIKRRSAKFKRASPGVKAEYFGELRRISQ
ncbi:MAG TPA: hypothetical protein VK395_01340 [Gemmataceae bacterium]|nr:hypothetical protein [Gemmataceae bacterium]